MGCEAQLAEGKDRWRHLTNVNKANEVRYRLVLRSNDEKRDY